MLELRTITAVLAALALWACQPEAACLAHPTAFVASKRAWPDGLVPLCWEDPAASDAADRNLVLATLDRQISRNAAVRFEDRGACPTTGGDFPGIRLGVADERPRSEGLGTELIGLPSGVVLNFTFAAWGRDCALNESLRTACIRSIALHEVLHALGFAHEQNRDDAPGDCGAGAQGESGDESIGAFDRDSVLNYCNARWNNGGVVSAGDVAGLRAVYGTRAAPRQGAVAPQAAACHG